MSTQTVHLTKLQRSVDCLEGLVENIDINECDDINHDTLVEVIASLALRTIEIKNLREKLESHLDDKEKESEENEEEN